MIRFVSLHLLSLVLLTFPIAHADDSNPITKAGFFRAVEIGGLSSEELAAYVQKLGVDFTLSEAERQTLRAKGLAENVLAVIRTSYRPPAAAKIDPETLAWLQGPPLSKDELVSKLKQGLTSDLAETAVKNRGIRFAVVSETARELEAVGASRGLIGVLVLASTTSAPQPEATPARRNLLPGESQPSPSGPSRGAAAEIKPPEKPVAPPAQQPPSAEAATPPPNSSPSGPVVVPMAVQAARLIKQAKINYPYQARREKVTGAVRFEAVIREDGTVERVLALSGHPLLVAAAEESVRKWVYAPAMINGKPTRITTEIEVRFAGSKE